MPHPSPSAAAERQLAALLHPLGVAVPRVPDLGAVVDAACAHRVAALLAQALERHGLLEALDDGPRRALRKAILDRQQQRALLDACCAAAADALDRAGIRYVALKGAALGATVYDEPALRPMTDVDLLVRPQDKVPALETLAAAGFERPSASEEAFWEESYYNLPLAAPGEAGGDGGAKLELHWSIAQAGRHAPDVDGIIARARRVDAGGRSLSVPHPVDLLLHQSLHLSYHYYEPMLIWLHDLALLHRDPPDAGETIARARAWGMRVPLALASVQVEKAFPGTVSKPFLRLLDQSPRARLLLAIAGSASPLALLDRWQERRFQLLYAVATLDRPSQIARSVGSWARRAWRHGDVAGRKRRV